MACSPQVDPQAAVKSARSHLDQGRAVDAAIEAKRALQIDPTLSEARFLLTLALMGSGDVPGAELELRRAIERGWPMTQSAPLLATLLTAQGKHKELVAELSAQSLDDPAAHAQLRTLLAAALSRTGKPAEAEKVIDELLQAQPAHRPARLEKARLLAATGKGPAALRVVDDLVAQDGQDADALLLKAELARAARGRVVDVLALYERAAAARPTLMPAHAALVSLSVARGDLPAARARWTEMNRHLPQHPQTFYTDASLAMLEGRPQHAREIVQRLLKDAPDNVRLLALGSQAEAALGGRESAIKMMQKAVQSEPDSMPLRVMQARILLDAGDADSALSALRMALRSSPDDVPLLMMQAQALVMLGQVAQADAVFDRAAKLRPGDGAVRTERALSRLARGQDDWALGELRAAAQADPRSISADVALFTARLQRGQYDAALAAANALGAKRPELPLAAFLRGRLALERGDAREARKAFEAALQKDPKHFASLSQLAAIDVAEGKTADAAKRVEGVLERDPTNLQALLTMARIAAQRPWAVQDVDGWLQKASKAHPKEVSVPYASVDLYLQMGQVDKARSLVETLSAQNDKSPELLDRLGRVQLAGGNAVAATATFNQLQGLQPRSAQPHLRLAQAYRQRQDWSMAALHANKALQASPGLFAARRLLAELALFEQGPKGGMSLVKALQKDYPREAAGWLLEGDAAMVQKQGAAAAAAYQQAMLKRQPADAAARAYRALVSAGNPAAAESLAADWLARHPADRGFMLQRADSAMRAGDREVAAARYREVLALEPNEPAANNNLAMLLVAQGKPESVALAEMAVKQMPGRAEYIDTLAQSLALVNRLPEALQWQAKAVALQPVNGDLSLTLARLHIQAGKPDLARVELQKLKDRGEKFRSQQEVTELLGKIGS